MNFSYSFWVKTKPCLLGIVFFFLPPLLAIAEIDISDRPLDVEFQAASTTVMFLLDDSGSMDFELMTTDDDGRYNDDVYIFDYDHDWSSSSGYIAPPSVWKTQWSGYNKIYYDPSVTYQPWQSHTAVDAMLDNANMLNPLTHQYQSGDFDDYDKTFNISNEFTAIEMTSGDPVCDLLINQTGADTSSGWNDIGCEFTVADGEEWQLVIERQEHDDNGNSTLAPGIKFVHSDGTERLVYPNSTTEYSEVGYWQYSSSSSNGILNRYTNQVGGKAYYRPDPVLPAGNYRISYYENNYSLRDKKARFFIVKRSGAVSIKNSHYYLLDDTGGGDASKADNGIADPGEALYLVNIDGSRIYESPGVVERKFYRVADNDLHITDGELTEISITDIPEAIRPPANSFVTVNGVLEEQQDGDLKDLQNFANWFSFYSRRGLVAKACVGRTIGGLEGLKVGLYSINNSVNLAALPVSVTDAVTGEQDYSNRLKLIGALYKGEDDGGTPLREGLRQIGRYYKGETSALRDEDGNSVSSPYDTADEGGSCQQVYAIAMTDGYWTDDDSFDYDIFDDPSSTEDPVHHDGISNTLADVAYYYYHTDLSPLGNNVPTNTCDSNAQQHMVTYSVSFGVTGTLNPDNYDACTLLGKTGAVNAAGDSVEGIYPQWPSSMSGSSPAKIDDLWHAAACSKGEFFSANNPNELIDSLDNIFTGIAAREISGASVAVSTEKIYSASSMFQGSYHSEKWTGEVEAYTIRYDSNLKGIRIADSPIWKASEKLADLTGDTRKIITYDPAGKNGVRFRWNDLPLTLKNLLLHTTKTDNADFSAAESASGENIVNYLRGEEAAGFRNRGAFIINEGLPNEATRVNKLGDIVHSSPILIGDHIYVGANDGMLHAFDKNTGVEVFAYIPGLVYEKLATLTSESYQHQFFVDQTPTYARVTNSDADGYDNYILGGLGKGGRGYYCLNITDVATAVSSENTAKEMIAWEFTDEGMGYSYSKPAVVRTRSSEYPYIVIVGNGYNSTSGEGAFYILDLLTGYKIKKLSTGVSGDNGVSSVIAIDVNNDYVVDYAYAGDLKGNLWKLDLTSTSTEDWNFAFFDGESPAPLFTTMANQPITSRPDVARHCKYHGYLVTFGTGKYLGISDLNTDDRQAMYAVWDYGDDSDDGECLGEFSGDMTAASQVSKHPDDTVDEIEIRARMLYQSPGSAMETAGGAVIKCTGSEFATWELIADKIDPNRNQVKNENQKGNPIRNIGWFLPMSGYKERIVQDPMILSGTLLFLSKSPVPGVCTGGGYSMVYSLGVCDGGQLECAWSTPDKKELNMPVPVDTPNGEKLIFGKNGAGELGRIDKDLAGSKIPKGIFYWEEIIDGP